MLKLFRVESTFLSHLFFCPFSLSIFLVPVLGHVSCQKKKKSFNIIFKARSSWVIIH